MTQCPQCNAEIPPDAPQGVCPKCLVQVGLGGNETRALHSLVLPPTHELAHAFPGLEVLELRGQGGMGAVYKARQKTLDRIVALKVLPMSVSQDPTFAERFTREARAMARLNHPNVVMVFDFGQANGLFYFVMEYVDGVNLREAIATERCDNKQALAIISQICDALQYAHDEGIVHRDIKPENVLLDKNGRVKIADFGLAKLLDAGKPGNFTLTGTKQVVGTMHYMAPEQLERPAEVDHRADLYSLGVVFYELLTGELPLGRFAPPSEKSHADADLDEVVLRSLEKEPDRRYQQASEIKTAVNNMPSAEVALPAPRRPRGTTLPFTVPDVRGGLLKANGIARLVGNVVTLEFEVVDHFFGWYRQPVQTMDVAVADLIEVGYRERFSTSLVSLRSDYMATFDRFPKNERGTITLHVVGKEDREKARQFTNELRALLGQEAISPPGTRWDEVHDFGPEELEPAESALRAPASCLFLTGVIDLVAMLIVSILFAAGGLNPRSIDFPWPLFVVGVPVGILCIVASARLARCQARRFGVAICILAATPIHVGWPIGILAGIWSLMVLRRPLVRQAFRWYAERDELLAEIPPEKVLADYPTSVHPTSVHPSAVRPRRRQVLRTLIKVFFAILIVGGVTAYSVGLYLYETKWKVWTELVFEIDGEPKEDPSIIKQVLTKRLWYVSRETRVEMFQLRPQQHTFRVTAYGRNRIASSDLQWRLSQRGQMILGGLAHPLVNKDILALAAGDGKDVKKDDVVVARWVPAPVGIPEGDVVQRRVDGIREALLLVSEYDLESADLRQATVVRVRSGQQLVLEFNVVGSRKLRMMNAAKVESDKQHQTHLGLVVDGRLEFTPNFTERTSRRDHKTLAVAIDGSDYDSGELQNWAIVLQNPLATKLKLKSVNVPSR